jgi:hypothetical protein
MRHDYEAWRENTWFHFSEKQDITTFYDVTSCPTALYWEEGSSLTTRPVRLTEEQEVSFQEWVTAQLVRSVSLINELGDDVEFLLTDDDQSTVVLVEAGSQTLVNVPKPWKAPVIGRRPQSTDILHAWSVVRNGQQLVLTQQSIFTYSNWIDIAREKRKLWKDARQFRTDHKVRQLKMLEEPPQLQSFTERGFTRQRMPASLYQQLLSLSQNTTAYRQSTESSETVLNK